MNLKTKIFNQTFQFKGLYEVMAKANEEKSGDKLAGICAANQIERVAAKHVLSDILLSDIRNNPAIPYEEDEVTRIIQDGINEPIYNSIKNMSVAEMRELLLSYKTTNQDIRRISRGMTSEMIAAVTKLMSNLDLIYCAKKIVVTAHCNTTIGEEGVLATRLQPNHPTDNVQGILASLYEGLSYGCGDAVLGINPVDDTKASVSRVLKTIDEVKNEWEIPTQTCVLAHITTQMEAIKDGAPSNLIFQSIAGSQNGNTAFGINAQMIEDARQLALSEGTGTGPNVMYFESGQGAELSSESHNGCDQLVMEARCYGFAKEYDPYIVNTVVGFIGPEYLYDSRQVIRAGLEDHFMGKLSGISMGCDTCYTNHMDTDQNDIENLAVLLAGAGCNYLICIPQGDDIMLNYQTLAYHDAAAIRENLGLKPISEFNTWLEKMGIIKDGRLADRAGDASIFTVG